MIFTPSEFKQVDISRIDSGTYTSTGWVSRIVQISGIAANSFANTHEDEFRMSFNKKRLHLLWCTVDRKITKYSPILQMRTKIGIVKISETNLLSNGKIKFATFKNSEIVNGNYVLHENKFVRNIPYEISGFDSFPQSNLIVNGKDLFAQEVSFSVNADEALFIGSSTNWYHFLIEILPRGIIWQENFGSQVPIVFHKPIPISIKRILVALGGFEPILVADGESAHVKSLTVALDARFDRQPDMLKIVPGENIFANRTSDLNLIEHWLKRSFPTKNSDFPTKVFLARGKDSLRPMSNFEEVQKYLETLGYVTIFPEKLHLEDQIALFSKVKSLVAEGGAALSGLIFAKQLKSLIHIEANPNFFVANFWQQFAEKLNLNSRACLGIPEHVFGYPTGRFAVNLDELQNLINGF